MYAQSASESRPVTVTRLREMKAGGEKIVSVTAYDAGFAAQAEAAGFTLETIGKAFSSALAANNQALKDALETALSDLAAAQAELVRLTS